DADLVTILNATSNKCLAVAGQGLVLRVGDLAGKAKAPRWIAVRTGIALDENAMKDRVLGKVNPVLLRQILPANAEVDAAHRDEAQARGRMPHFRRRFLTHQSNEHRQGHGAN